MSYILLTSSDILRNSLHVLYMLEFYVDRMKKRECLKSRKSMYIGGRVAFQKYSAPKNWSKQFSYKQTNKGYYAMV